ncbi:MAG: uroporphyrinogen-III synthase [Pseudomonadota bacterium]
MTGRHADAPLQGIGVLVTRPREQAAGLAERLRQAGAEPVLFPALAILPPHDASALRETIARLADFDLAIFISPTAAQRGLAHVQTWPAGLAVAAVGKGTAAALRELGIDNVLVPEDGADSEHLLALPRLKDMAGRRVLIFRGEGGREALAEALAARGAEVGHAVCYRRGLPEGVDPAPLLARLAAGGVHAVTAYSGETLDNLLRLLGDAGRDMLRRLPLFVPHPRIAEHARQLGFREVVVSEGGEAQLLAALVEYFTHD